MHTKFHNDQMYGSWFKTGEPTIGEEVGGREQELGTWPFGVYPNCRNSI